MTGVSVPPAGESGQDVTDMTAILLGPSGPGSDFGSEPGPTVTPTRDADDAECVRDFCLNLCCIRLIPSDLFRINVLGTTCAHEPPPTPHLEDPDASVSQVNVTLPRGDMVCHLHLLGILFSLILYDVTQIH